MTVDELASHLDALKGAGLGSREVVIQVNLTYERVGAPEYVKTIYRGQNPHEIPEPFIALVKETK